MTGSGDDAALYMLSLADGGATPLRPDVTLPQGTLAIDPSTGRYCTFAHSHGALARACRSPDAPGLQRTSWRGPGAGFNTGSPVHSDVLLWTAPKHDPSPGGWARLRWLLSGKAPDITFDLLAVPAGGAAQPILHSAHFVRCTLDDASDDRSVCSTVADADSVLWEVDARSRSYHAIAKGELGWRSVLRGSELVTVDRDFVRYVRLDLRREWRWSHVRERCTRDIDMSEHHIAVLDGCGKSDDIRLLRKPDVTR